ncbi:hypothetical protein [Streptomyces rishiriensis]|uniref:Uncharacterized protein n=1 Tax=Streptomyces rishiriensis TaxID=68264 RepID=A0ABU0P335_STRRH|nr:hypothetical protein [Streptomyces rishiriensis]MDQ0585789.1 hypothetical protein [Streptomyces rishiriensis]
MPDTGPAPSLRAAQQLRRRRAVQQPRSTATRAQRGRHFAATARLRHTHRT